jgi:hypothetical protein
MLCQCDRVALHNLSRFAPLETFTIKDSFLGIASALCGVATLGLCRALLGDLNWARVPFCFTQTSLFSHLVTIETDKTDRVIYYMGISTNRHAYRHRPNQALGRGICLLVRTAGWHASDPGSIRCRYGLWTFGCIPPALWVCFEYASA